MLPKRMYRLNKLCLVLYIIVEKNINKTTSNNHIENTEHIYTNVHNIVLAKPIFKQSKEYFEQIPAAAAATRAAYFIGSLSRDMATHN